MTVDIALQKNNDQQVFEEEGVRRARHIPTFLCLCLDIKTSCLPELFRFSELKKFVRILFIFWREGKGRRERGREHWCVRETLISCLSEHDLAHNPRLCPAWE